ncbi:MAG: transporter substrate-binding domain-containing protein [Bacteroidota bacterium]|nr:transporter substrate-binding domain-containing protein [Bacteroidota bacterium]
MKILIISKTSLALLTVSILVISFLFWKFYTKGEGQKRDFAEIKRSGVIRIATEYNSVGYFVSGDSIKGFEYELALLLGKRFGIKVEVIPQMNFEESMKRLNEKSIDIVARPITITTQLRNQYRFTQPILLNKQVLVQRKPDFGKTSVFIRNQIELAKKTLYVHKNSPVLLRIRNLSNEIGDTIYTKEDEKYGDEQLIAMVSGGEIDYAVCDESIARQLQSKYPGLDFDTDISFTQLQAWMVRKESKVLLDSLNVWLKEIKKSEEYNTIYEKYFGTGKK